MQSIYSRERYLPLAKHRGTDYLDYQNALYLNIRNKLVTETYYTVEGQYEGYPELIAYKFWGTVDLWWVLCVANNVIDPLTDIVTGKELKIPTLFSIDSALNSIIPTKVGTIVEV